MTYEQRLKCGESGPKWCPGNAAAVAQLSAGGWQITQKRVAALRAAMALLAPEDADDRESVPEPEVAEHYATIQDMLVSGGVSVMLARGSKTISLDADYPDPSAAQVDLGDATTRPHVTDAMVVAACKAFYGAYRGSVAHEEVAMRLALRAALAQHSEEKR